MKKKITTVCGDIAPEELGLTSMHEHLNMDMGMGCEVFKDAFPPLPDWRKEFKVQNMAFARTNPFYYKEAVVVEDEEFLENELKVFKECGGRAIVECSPNNIRGDVRMLRTISAKANVHIICSTGLGNALWRGNKGGKYAAMDEEATYEMIVGEIKEGIEDTDIRPGAIKCMVENKPEKEDFHSLELLAFNAGARAAAETGRPLFVHTLPTLPVKQVIQLADWAVNKYGVEPDKVVMCHQDLITTWIGVEDYIKGRVSRQDNYEQPSELLKMGVNIGIDSFGNLIGADASPNMPCDDFARVREISHFIDKGYGDHIVLGHDLFAACEGVGAGLHGFTRITEFVVPLLQRVGYGEKEIEKLIVENPARILAHD